MKVIKNKNNEDMFKKYLNNQKGFTLIEMVIVIVVIGILMGLAFQGITTVQQNARDTRRLADLRRIQTQLELFFSRCGHYPVNATAACVANPTTSETLNQTQLRTVLGLVVTTTDVPFDPLPARIYSFRASSDGLQYAVGALMERLGTNPNITGTQPVTGGLNCTTGTGGLYCLRS